MSSCVLDIQNLQTILFLEQGAATVVDGVSLRIHSGETLALVGESGCGKTMTAYSVMRLVPSPPGKIVRGKIMFEGCDLLTLPENRMREIRGNRISMVFQEPLTSLNPVFRIGNQIAEVLQVHHALSKKHALAQTVGLLEVVGIPDPHLRVRDYPHQMSGGMRQRVMIAMALACGPRLVIADEPTTALDVTVQAQILELLQRLKQQRSMAMLLITHDLGVVAEAADNVAVMYAGRVVEFADVRSLFHRPLNPYTVGLMDSLPHFGRDKLKPIQGMVPPLLDQPPGCKFSTRCDRVFHRCRVEEPELLPVQGGGDFPHLVRCWLYQK